LPFLHILENNLTPLLLEVGYCHSLLIKPLKTYAIKQFSKLERRRKARLPGQEGKWFAPCLPGNDLTLLKVM